MERHRAVAGGRRHARRRGPGDPRTRRADARAGTDVPRGVVLPPPGGVQPGAPAAGEAAAGPDHARRRRRGARHRHPHPGAGVRGGLGPFAGVPVGAAGPRGPCARGGRGASRRAGGLARARPAHRRPRPGVAGPVARRLGVRHDAGRPGAAAGARARGPPRPLRQAWGARRPEEPRDRDGRAGRPRRPRRRPRAGGVPPRAALGHGGRRAAAVPRRGPLRRRDRRRLPVRRAAVPGRRHGHPGASPAARAAARARRPREGSSWSRPRFVRWTDGAAERGVDPRAGPPTRRRPVAC